MKKFLSYLKTLRSSFLPDLCFVCHRGINESVLCGYCRTYLPWLMIQERGFFGIFRYEAPIDHFIVALKFKQQLRYAFVFSQLLREGLQQRSEPLPGAIMPIPLHPHRLRQRGFNQAWEIAKPVAKCFGIPLLEGRRIKDTKPQTELNVQDRRNNLQNAFSVPSHGLPKHVAVVDDVFTTGCTYESLHKTLQAKGVKKVELWYVARASVNF